MKSIFVVVLLALVSACATYVTPGAGVPLKMPSTPEEDADALVAVEPRARFPARIAIARVQAPDYYAKGTTCQGSGKYCVVITREAETEKEMERIARFPEVAGLAPIVRLSTPASFQSHRDLRSMAANLKADILLLYSIDTAFRVDTKSFGPLDVISLGMLPKKNTYVRATASALLLDVQTGFVYGEAEATASEENNASGWSTVEKIEAARLRTESAGFQRLVSEVEKLWADVVKEHGGKQN